MNLEKILAASLKSSRNPEAQAIDYYLPGNALPRLRAQAMAGFMLLVRIWNDHT